METNPFGDVNLPQADGDDLLSVGSESPDKNKGTDGFSLCKRRDPEVEYAVMHLVEAGLGTMEARVFVALLGPAQATARSIRLKRLIQEDVLKAENIRSWLTKCVLEEMCGVDTIFRPGLVDAAEATNRGDTSEE